MKSAKAYIRANWTVWESNDTLINNAGFGGHGKFHETWIGSRTKNDASNMLSLQVLTHYLSEGDGCGATVAHILNIFSSRRQFMPWAASSGLYATKAYVSFLTQLSREKLIDSNVTATGIMPWRVATGICLGRNLEGVWSLEKCKSPRSVCRIRL